MRISFAHSEVLDHFLALYREVRGRFAWETSLVQRPFTPVIAGMAEGLRSWRAGGLLSLPHWTTELDPRRGDSHVRNGTRLIRDALAAAGPELTAGLLPWAGRKTEAEQELRRLLPFDAVAPRFGDALGVSVDLELTVYPVVFAPNPPALGFLADGDTPVGMYIDCRRFTGTTLADCVLTMAGWAALRTAPDGAGVPADLAGRLPGGGPYHRRLRALLTKVLVEITAGELVRSITPAHRSCVDVLGTAWRYPRLFAVADRHWSEYLAGLVDRASALSAMTAEISEHSPRWYVDHVDASALAADFYLMEWLSSAGDEDARRRLARWLPLLAGDFAQQLDLIIGAELGHYERAKWQDAELAGFLTEVTTGDSRAAWPRMRAAMGETRALALAHQAFAGPGAEFGGEAWAPVAAMMHRYACGDLPRQVFVDQCFTLQHNNGSLFDKFFDTTTMQLVLDAQAAGDMELLAEHASAEVRARWLEHQNRVRAEYPPSWLGTTALPSTLVASPAVATVWEAQPGALGCGTAEEPEALGNGWLSDDDREIRVRQPIFRRPLPATLTEYPGVTARLRTTLGVVELELLPGKAPYTVDNFVRLAQGTRRWVDPATGADGVGGFYDGTTFHRRVAGFLVQGGDRTGTGHGGPGYRLGEEIDPDLPFDRPFLVGMANSGNDSTGSQFFVTLAAAPHLSGRFTCFGSVPDPISQQVLTAIAAAADPVVLTSVQIVVHSKSS